MSRRDNLITDFLSKLIHTGDSPPVDDDFLDENLFSISMQEHLPRQASQSRERKIAGRRPTQIFENTLKLLRGH
jgi:hypothetical protein